MSNDVDRSRFIRVENLRKLVKAAGGNAAFARQHPGVDVTFVSQLLNGHRSFGEKAARAMEQRIGKPYGWLDQDHSVTNATGLGPMRPASPEPIEPGEEFVPVTRIKLKLQAGITGFTVEHAEGNGPPIFFRRDFLQARGWNPERLFALKVTGDSMEPALFDGDLVVVNTAETMPMDGEVFAVNYEGEAVIKRLRRDAGQWWLDSDNPRHKSKRYDEHAILIGRVVYKQSERI